MRWIIFAIILLIVVLKISVSAAQGAENISNAEISSNILNGLILAMLSWLGWTLKKGRTDLDDRLATIEAELKKLSNDYYETKGRLTALTE